MIKLPIIRTTADGAREVTDLRFHTGWVQKDIDPIPYYSDDEDDSDEYGTSIYRCVDIDDRPVTGVFYESHGGRKYTFIINTGMIMRLYSYPDVEISFRSPTVRWWNLFYCGGWSMCDDNNDCISSDPHTLRAVASGQKPMGFIYCRKDDLEEQLDIITHYKLAYSTTPARYSADRVEIGICPKVKVGEMFNILVVLRSYELLSIAQEEMVLDSADIEFFTSLQDRPLESFLTGWDYANPVTNRDLALTGLLLGYPIESTFALMC